MTHSHKRTSHINEFLMTSVSGFGFGAANVIVGQPMDTVKTKMQAQTEHMLKGGLVETTGKVWRTEGLIGFYRGSIPPFIGSVMYRSLQFSVFEMIYTYCDRYPFMKKEIPHTHGLQVRVPLCAFVGGSVRAFFECPFEYAKVKR